MKDLPLISIIIVNHNGKKYLKNCFESILEQRYLKDKIEVLMVDNCSMDDSITFTIRNYPSVKVIKNDENNYCKANNLGIKKSKGDYIVFLNNDTVVDKDWLINLVKTASSNPRIGAVGSKILLKDGRINSTGHREQPNYYYSDEGFKEKDEGQYDTKEEVESICGCSVLYKKSCLEDVGGFDEDFIIYCEDVDMSIRCKKKGWKLFFAPKSVVTHEYNGSGNLDLQKKFVERNRLLLIAKHHPQMLPENLLVSDYYLKKENLFDIAPLIVNKIIKHHGVEIFLKLLPSLIDSFKKYEFMKKDYLIKEFDAERAEFKDSKARLRHEIHKRDKEACRKEKEKRIKDQEYKEEFKKLKDLILEKEKRHKEEIGQKELIHSKKIEELSKEKELIHSKEKEELSKEKEVLIKKIEEKHSQLFKQQEDYYKSVIHQLDEKYKLKKDELSRIYNSKTHQLITSNIWALANLFKKRKNKYDTKQNSKTDN